MFLAEGTGGNLVNSIVKAKGRGIVKFTYDGCMHLLFGGGEMGRGKPVLGAWPGNNPLLPLGALLLGCQFWMLLSTAALGRRQRKFTKGISVGPDFNEQAWIRNILCFSIRL